MPRTGALPHLTVVASLTNHHGLRGWARCRASPGDTTLIDLRYHIVSLAAVFLALAVGILIGTSMVGTPSVEKHIRRLRVDFDKVQKEDRRLQGENQDLRQKTRVLETGLRQVVPQMVRGRLAAKHVAVLSCGRMPDASLLREIKFLLTSAGAAVTSITTFQGNLLPENPSSRKILLDATGIEATDLERARRHMAARIVRETLLGRDPSLVRLLGQYSPGLLLDGDYSVAADAAVFLPTASNDAEERALAEGTSIQARIADALREQGITTVVCETQQSAVPLIPYFARYNLTTVDGVDTPLGKIALVYALAGKQGHYGTRPPAAQLLPDLDTEPATQPGDAPPSRSQQPAPPEPARPHASLLRAPARSGRSPASR